MGISESGINGIEHVGTSWESLIKASPEKLASVY